MSSTAEEHATCADTTYAMLVHGNLKARGYNNDLEGVIKLEPFIPEYQTLAMTPNKES